MPDLSHPVRLADLAVQWRPDWLSAAVLAVLTIVFLNTRLRLRAAGRPWPPLRNAALAVGILLAVWVTCGFPLARGSQLMWVWTMQALLLLLVVPTVLVTADRSRWPEHSSGRPHRRGTGDPRRAQPARPQGTKAFAPTQAPSSASVRRPDPIDRPGRGNGRRAAPVR